MYIILIFIKVGAISHVIAHNELDISLSEETKNNLSFILDPTIRSNFEHLAKIHKFQRNRFYPAMEYVVFHCAVSEIKADLENFYPRCSISSDYGNFVKGIKRRFPLPDELEAIVKLFLKIEIGYPELSDNDRAHKEIPLYFDSMYALLSRCKDRKYWSYLIADILDMAESLRDKVLALKNLTEKSSKSEQSSAFVEFSSFYARIRHVCNGFHHLYGRVIRNSKTDLVELLHSMGLLKAWNFTAKDVEYINELRSILHPSTHKILMKPYSFEVERNGKRELNSGILPAI